MVRDRKFYIILKMPVPKLPPVPVKPPPDPRGFPLQFCSCPVSTWNNKKGIDHCPAHSTEYKGQYLLIRHPHRQKNDGPIRSRHGLSNPQVRDRRQHRSHSRIPTKGSRIPWIAASSEPKAVLNLHRRHEKVSVRRSLALVVKVGVERRRRKGRGGSSH